MKRIFDCTAVLAALLHIVNPPPEMREKYERVNVGGTANVVEAAIKAGVKRIVLFSTIAVYGQADGQPIGTVLRLGAVYGSRIKGNYPYNDS